MENWPSVRSSADLAAGASPDHRATAIFQLFVIGVAIIIAVAIFAEVTTFLGTLWDDPRGWVILFAGLALLIWALASHNEVVAIIGTIVALADLIGLFFHLTDIGALRREACQKVNVGPATVSCPDGEKKH